MCERACVRVSQPSSKKGVSGWVYIEGFSSFPGVWRIIASCLARLLIRYLSIKIPVSYLSPSLSPHRKF